MSERRPELRLLAVDRRMGKTTEAFAWVSNGVKVGGYPGWSRVLIQPTQAMVDYHRREYWHRLEDYDHRVYSLRDWADSMGANRDTEVCIEELQEVMGDRALRHLPGNVVAATMTAWPWESQFFREAREEPRWMT